MAIEIRPIVPADKDALARAYEGVGSRLTAALADRARAEGITSFSAVLLADNEMMMGLLEELG